MSMKIGGWLAIFMKDLHLGIDNLFNSHVVETFYQKKKKNPKDAMDYLDEIAKNSNTWTGPTPMESTNRTRTNNTTSSGSVFKLKEDDNMSTKINN